MFSVMKISFLHVNFHTKKAQGKGRGIAFASLEQQRLGGRGITGIPMMELTWGLCHFLRFRFQSLIYSPFRNGVCPGFSYSRYTIYSSPAKSSLTLSSSCLPPTRQLSWRLTLFKASPDTIHYCPHPTPSHSEPGAGDHNIVLAFEVFTIRGVNKVLRVEKQVKVSITKKQHVNFFRSRGKGNSQGAGLLKMAS